MKRFKIGVLAIVAILAMSFTLIEKSDALKSTPKLDLTLSDDDCFKPKSGWVGKSDCTTSFNISTETTCESAQQNYEGLYLFQNPAIGSDFFESTTQELDCPSGNT